MYWHGNYIVDHGKTWKNHRIGFLNFCGNPETDFCKIYSAQNLFYVLEYFLINSFIKGV